MAAVGFGSAGAAVHRLRNRTRRPIRRWGGIAASHASPAVVVGIPHGRNDGLVRSQQTEPTSRHRHASERKTSPLRYRPNGPSVCFLLRHVARGVPLQPWKEKGLAITTSQPLIHPGDRMDGEGDRPRNFPSRATSDLIDRQQQRLGAKLEEQENRNYATA